MDADQIQDHLLSTARALRPVGRPFISVLQLADELGAAVMLRLQVGLTVGTAQIDLGTRPATIILYRPANLNGERAIRPWEESLLTSRERFSVAHELGHWILYNKFNIGAQREKRLYWAQEQAINAFAGSLLVPDWLASRWLEGTPAGTPVSPFDLKHWANAISQCSEEVVVKSLVRGRDSIGFLKLLRTERSRDRIPILKVLCSAAGRAVALPKENSHICDAKLVALLGGVLVGQAQLREVRLGRCSPQRLQVAWRRGGPLKSQETIWVSVALYISNREPEANPQLSIQLEKRA